MYVNAFQHCYEEVNNLDISLVKVIAQIFYLKLKIQYQLQLSFYLLIICKWDFPREVNHKRVCGVKKVNQTYVPVHE